ncbi:hypothetical protein [Paraburkholderia antibiotica]|uniref:Uncharacterized protein n=1 Tax=Paraburkholderia antibiotica TaxID=2728839 RepID=A0A7X9ZZK3_9BURK|nr:hypothetical protein [Paraburkholderia antibiotica]NML32828.1 hypothetical protein [Paraburkholderia antibiotica]
MSTTYSKAWLVAACVAVSGAAFAQAGGGNGNGGTGSGNAHGAATAAPTAGNEPASNAPGATGGAMTNQHHHVSKSKSKRPATDSTNTPGADASSDTKGQ